VSFFDSSGGDWLNTKRLGFPLVVKISAPGYEPREITLTEGPREWTAKDKQVFRKEFYYIKDDHFHVVLSREVDYAEQGSQQLAHGDYADAVSSFEKAIQRNPRNADLHLKCSQGYLGLGRLEDAAEMLREAVGLNPRCAEWFFDLGNVYMKLHKYEEAQTAFGQAVQERPRYADAWLTLGTAQATLGDHAAAVSSLRKAVQIDESLVVAYSALGKSLSSLNEFEQAVQAYERALELGSDDTQVRRDLGEAYLNLGKSRLQHGDFNDAVAAFQHASERDPSLSAEASYLTAEAIEAVGDYEKATSAYGQVASLLDGRATKTADEDAWLGAAYNRLGQYGRAVGALRDSSSLRPDARTYLELALALYMLNAYQASLDAADASARLRPGDPQSDTAKCRAYVGMNRGKEALEECKEALRMSPDDAESLYYMGAAWEQLDEQKKAEEAYRASIAQESARLHLDAYGHFLRGNALYSVGDTRGAIADYLDALRRQPGFNKAIFNLGVACLAATRRDCALDQYKKLLPVDPDRAAKLYEKIRGAGSAP
jgi:superkiller protein 3